MTLQDTVALMLSDNWDDRFRAEYWQTRIRLDRLEAMMLAWVEGDLDFEPKSSFDLLQGQARAMDAYLHWLEDRAAMEGVPLEV